MKKKFLCLILIILLCPMVSVFSACKKFDGYNLNNLESDFYAIAETNKNVLKVDNKLVFDYSNFSTLNNLVSTKKPYSELNKYNEVYENILSFVFEHIQISSNNDAIKSKDFRNSIENDLEGFASAIDSVDEDVTALGEIVNVTTNYKSSACLYRLERLLCSYEKLFEKASVLANSISNLYFNHILNNGNPNPYEMVEGDYALNKDSFEPDIFIGRINSRIKYQVSNLSQCFAEMNISDDVAKQIAQEDGSLNLNANNYKTNIVAINKTIAEENAFSKANQNKKLFYTYVVKAYNLQVVLEENVSLFEYACNEVSYLSKNEDISTNDELCVDIIANHNENVLDYNNVLKDILILLGA